MRQRRAFTLLELMVVLALLAITAVAAAPAFLNEAARTPEQRAAREIAERLIATRDLARESGSTTTFTLSPSDVRYWVVVRDSMVTGRLALGAGLRITPTQERIELRFDPTGGSSGSELTIAGARGLTIRVGRLNGDVTIHSGKVQIPRLGSE